MKAFISTWTDDLSVYRVLDAMVGGFELAIMQLRTSDGVCCVVRVGEDVILDAYGDPCYMRWEVLRDFGGSLLVPGNGGYNQACFLGLQGDRHRSRHDSLPPLGMWRKPNSKQDVAVCPRTVLFRGFHRSSPRPRDVCHFYPVRRLWYILTAGLRKRSIHRSVVLQ